MKLKNITIILLSYIKANWYLLLGFLLIIFLLGYKMEIILNKKSPYYFSEKKLILKTIHFDKFVIVKNIFHKLTNNKNSFFSRVWVFYIKGKAYLEVPLYNFKYKNGYLIYKGFLRGRATKGEIIPFDLVIDIDPDNFFEVYEVKPRKITEKEAQIVSRGAGIVAGLVGGYVFAKVMGNVSEKVCQIFPISSKFSAICNIAGTTVGGVVGGAGTYIYVSNLIYKSSLGKQFIDNFSIEEKERLLEEVKKAIVTQLFMDRNLVSIAQKAFEDYIRTLFESYGIPFKGIKYEITGDEEVQS